MIDCSPLERHDQIALSFSGGKDSLACVYLLREYLHRIVIYHLDTGDLLPEMRASVDHVKGFAPNFVHIQGDVDAWIERNGLPTDLVPHSAHRIGQAMGEAQTKLVARYDCCWANLMLPAYTRMVADGNSLIIRGTKAVDMTTLPLRSGDVTEGVELFYPLQGWSNEQVFAYLKEVGAPIPPIYQCQVNSPECARCSAWWGEGRNAYLRTHYPDLWLAYRARLGRVRDELRNPLIALARELR